jgi:transcriptional regulator with XRE-family HTH domain
MVIVDNIEKYCEKNSSNVMQFEKKCGLGKGVIYRWKKGEQKPSLRTLDKISSATGISIEKWLRKGGI